LKESPDPHGRYAGGGHVAALYQNELYELITGRSGVTRLQAFGVIFGHSRVALYLEPHANKARITANTARTNLLWNGEALPWAEWAAEFREKVPDEITQLMEQVAAGAASTDHHQSIKERLKQIRDLLRISRYKPAHDGKVNVDEESFGVGGRTAGERGEKQTGSAKAGGRGGRGGDIYALFLTAHGTPGEELRFDQDPAVTWVTVADGTRTPPDMEDRAAKFLPQQNRLLINGDFRVFIDMVKRWCDRYANVPGSKPVVEQIVREWFEQQLVEAVLGAQTLRDSRYWTVNEIEKLWTEEALTATILPRYHIENNVKRALGAKLGTLKDRAA
jgi:hypothetical protein